MNESHKRSREEYEIEDTSASQEERWKRFEGKKLISWTESIKNVWISQSSSTGVLSEFNLFICKQVLDSIYDSNVGETNCWNIDLLCQKWQLRNKEIGMILSFSDPSNYYCNQDDYDDWGIEFQSLSLVNAIPSEEEVNRAINIICSFQRDHPDLLIGLMNFPDASISTYIAIHYLMRIKQLSLDSIQSQYHLVDQLPEQLKQRLPSSQQKWIRAIQTFTRRPFLLPMRMEGTMKEIPKEDLLCSWIPHGKRIFLYISNGKGVLITSNGKENVFLDTLPFTFVNSKGQLHTNTLCDGFVVTESKLDKPIQRILLSDVLYINGLSLRSLPFTQRVQELHKEVVECLKKSREKDLQAIRKSPYQSIGMHDFWPLKEIQKILTSFIPSLTHEADGVVLLDPKSMYTYGDQPSRMWKFEGDVH